uniref:Uncharacterized protein n=1 Tax=Meloidogyne floridensis TaxID=298350 RepID=A0A915P5N4_9BILA
MSNLTNVEDSDRIYTETNNETDNAETDLDSGDEWSSPETNKRFMFNVFKTNYRNFPSSLTKLRFLHYSRYLKNINELKENNIQSTSNLIPSEIEQNLQRWEKGIKLSFDFSENPNVNQLQNQWMGLSLECVDIKQHPSPFITLSTKNLSKSQLSSLRLLNLKAGRNIDLKILEPNSETIIDCAFLSLSYYNLVVKTNIFVFDTSALRENIKGKCFDIRLSRNYSLKKAINLIENREEFAKYKGYDAMLYASNNYDSSQLTALSALLNKNRPIVAVHGAAGTGKTLLLAQYLDILSKSDESKDMPIAVISPSISSLYRLIDLYCSIASKEILKEMPFICLKEFNAAGAYFSIKNQNVLQLMKGLIDEEISKFIKKRRFVFLTCSFAMLNFLERIGVKFSGVIVDNAERL